ncbi:hypothetical protein ACT5YR_07085 [Fructobacillus fructosus]|uniref:hypothetical protein n=1 Tax=Fructobacillus fructosus TaxID=1631 RepID=UPI004033A57E
MMVGYLLVALLVGTMIGISFGYYLNLTKRNNMVEEAYYLGYEQGRKFGYKEEVFNRLRQQHKD